MTMDHADLPSHGIFDGLRRRGLWLLMATVLLIPKLLSMRRNRRRWNVLRLTTATLGALVFLGAILWRDTHDVNGLFVAGCALMLLAAMAFPETPKLNIDQRARELGAVVVVEGGRYRSADQPEVSVNLFIGKDCVWLLDKGLHIRREIPFSLVEPIRVEPADGSCTLSIGPPETPTSLTYRGPFASHFAQVAQATLCNQLRHELPILR